MHHSLAIPAILFLLAAPNAGADPETLGPPGWARTTSGAIVQYQAPSGQEQVVVRNLPDHDDPLEAAREIIGSVGGTPKDCALQSDRMTAMCDATIAGSGFDLRIRGYTVQTGDGLVGLLHMGLADSPGLERRLDRSGERIRALSVKVPAERAPAPPAETGTSPGHIERVLFELNYVSGIGGAFYPQYAPVYLFKTGEACRCADLAPEDAAPNALRRARSGDVGQWRRTGTGFEVRYDDGTTDELDPTIGPPAHVTNGRLSGHYRSLGGGGNTALGGNTMIIASEDYDFRANGTFSQQNFGGGGNGGVTAGSTRNTVGQWSLDGATLSLTYPDGRKIRTSVYRDSNGDLTHGSPDLLWIGGEPYTLEE